MTLLKRIVFVVAAMVVGVLATRPVITRMMDDLSIRNGPWRTSLGTGSAEANRYERAAIAVAGLYALSRAETIYYTAFTDAGGAPLDGRCDYVLRGRSLPARWWSLTMYGADHYLVANSANVFSRHANNLEFEADGSYVVPVSATAQPRNWLPAPPHGAFSITLRLYNPLAEAREHPDTVALPALERGSCR